MHSISQALLDDNLGAFAWLSPADLAKCSSASKCSDEVVPTSLLMNLCVLKTLSGLMR